MITSEEARKSFLVEFEKLRDMSCGQLDRFLQTQIRNIKKYLEITKQQGGTKDV